MNYWYLLIICWICLGLTVCLSDARGLWISWYSQRRALARRTFPREPGRRTLIAFADFFIMLTLYLLLWPVRVYEMLK